MNDDNVFTGKFGAVKGGKDEDAIPTNDYQIIDIDDEVFAAHGFLVFTPHHVAVMRDTDKGAIPVVVVPLERTKAAGIVDHDEEPKLL